MGKFTLIPIDTFQGLQLEAGVLLLNFDPETGEFDKAKDIICATTGGINVVCQPEYNDLGEDVDNCPNNMMELKQIVSWLCTLGFTSLATSLASIALSLGAADVDEAAGKVTPRRSLKLTDFKGVWWVGDRADGGMVAVHLLNALSTGGFSLQTTKGGKGQNTMELTGHVSIDAQDVVPMEFYSKGPESGGGVAG